MCEYRVPARPDKGPQVIKLVGIMVANVYTAGCFVVRKRDRVYSNDCGQFCDMYLKPIIKNITKRYLSV